MSCSSCKHLKDDKKYPGALCGAKYFCGKVKTYVYGDSECEAYSKSLTRKNHKCDEIYRDGKDFCDDDKPVSTHLLILLFVVVMGILITIFT